MYLRGGLSSHLCAIGKRVITLMLVFQFVVPLSHSSQGDLVDRVRDAGQEIIDQDADARARVERLQALADQLEGAAQNEAPRGTPDAYHLLPQGAVFYRARGPELFEEFALGRPNRDLPNVTISDFEREVRIEVEGQSLHFYKYRGNILESEHFIRDINPVALVRDVELLQFVDASGKIYAIDLILARSLLFKASVPIFEVGRVPDSVLQAIRNGHELNLRFLRRSMRELADMEISPDAIVPHEVLADFEPGIARQSLYRLLRNEQVLVAGDLVITTSAPGENAQTLHGIFDREVTMTQVFTGEGLLAIAMHSSSPVPSHEANQAIQALLADSTLRTAIQSQERAQASEESLREYDPADQMRLALRAATIREQQSNPSRGRRDLILLQELRDLPADITTEVVPASKSSYLQRLRFYATSLTPKKVHRAVFLMTIGAGTSAYAAAVNDIGPAWAVRFANETWQNYAPQVLKDKVYRRTLLKGTLSLLAIVPLTKAIYALAGQLGGVGWSALKTFATISARVTAVVQLPFLVGLTWLTRQRNFVHAARNGLNPFTTPGGLNSPIASSATIRQNRERINAITANHEQLRALAWTIAGNVVARRTGIDPATLAALQRGDLSQLNNEELRARLESPAFLAEHRRLTRELYLGYRQAPQLQEQLASLSVEEWVALNQQAHQVAARIASDTGLARAASRLRLNAREALESGLWRAVGNAGQEIYHYLMNVESSETPQNISWNRYTVDYPLTVLQTGVSGDRANLSAPADLTSQEGAFLSSNPQYLSDTFDGLYGYLFRTPAQNILTFQRDHVPTETAYNPIENTTLVPSLREEGFFESLRNWASSAINLREAGYGYLAWKQLTNRLRSIQSLMLTEITFRVLLGQQPLFEAIPATSYMFVWAYWIFVWQWDVVVRGNEISDSEFGARLQAYTEAKRKLEQGRRLGDAALAREGLLEMNRLYAADSPDVHPELRNALQRAEELLELSPSELSERRERLSRYTSALVQLQRTLHAHERQPSRQSLRALGLAHENLMALHRGESVPFDELGPQALLDYSLEHPPVNVSRDGWALKVPFAVGSLVTTYAYSGIGVDSFHGISWGDVAHFGAVSAILYGVTYYGQKALNAVVDHWKATAPQRRALPPEASTALPVTPPLSVCELQMIPESQRPVSGSAPSTRERIRDFLNRLRGTQ